MFVYWSMYAIPAFVALFEKTSRNRNSIYPIVLFFLLLFLVMAFRQSGGDFYTYNLMIQRFSAEDILTWMTLTDPAYGFLNWLSIQVGWGIYGVNFFCALFFLFSLYRYSIGEPRPWLLIAIAMPYLLIVVAIGYTRQGTAIGFIMLALTYIRRGSLFKSTVSIVLAASFHSASLIAAPLLYYTLIESRKLKFVSVSIYFAFILGIYEIVDERIEYMAGAYLETRHYQSSGAVQRSFITAIAAFAFFLWRRRWRYLFNDWRIYFVVSLVALALFPLSFFQSTVADRIGLFLLPFQVLVFARLPVLQSNTSMTQLATVGVIVAYALVLFVWLHMGQFSQKLWLPYSSLLMGPLS